MAKILQITDGTDTLDLLAGVFRLADAGWQAQQSDVPTWETFTLIGSGTDAQIRSEQDKIDRLAEVAYNYVKDILEKTPVYLRIQSEGETVRRAVVMNMATQYGTESNVSALLGANSTSSNTVILLTLAVYRTPAFEPESATTKSTTGISTSGGKWIPPTSNAGVLDQRIATATFSSTTATAALYKMWIGIRKVRLGLTDLQSLWECENGTMISADTTTAADATASNSSKVQCTFATTAALAKRFTLFWQSAATGGTTPTDDIIGEYLVLGRVKLSSSSTEVRILLKHGWQGLSYDREIAGDTYLSAVQNSNLTNWNLIELGRVKLPPTGNRDGIGEAAGDIPYIGLNVWAERMSASGTLDMDCFILIPTDYLLYLEQCYVWASGGPTKIYTSPLNEQYALSRTGSTGAIINTLGSFNNWFYPAGGGALIIAAQELGQHTLGWTVDITLDLYPRYKIYKV